MNDTGEKLRALFEEAADGYRPTDEELVRLDERILLPMKEIGGRLPPSRSWGRVASYGAVGLGVALLAFAGVWQFSHGGSSNAAPGAGSGERPTLAAETTRGRETLSDAPAAGPGPHEGVNGAAGGSLSAPSEATQVPTLAVDALPSVEASRRAQRGVADGHKSRGPSAATDIESRQVTAGASRSSLEEEVRLVRAASARRRAGDIAGALVLIDEHARQYPHGVLSDERDVERIVALCGLGAREQAKAHAKVFLSARPESPLAERVRASCAGGGGGERP